MSRGLAENARDIGLVHRQTGRLAEAARWLDRGLEHARSCDDHVSFQKITRSLVHVLVDGPLPAAAATARCEDLLAANGGDRVLEPTISSCLAELHAMAGRLDEARGCLELARRAFGPADTLFAALAQTTIGRALVLTGDLAAARQAHEARWRFFRAAGDQDGRTMDSAEHLARFCCATGEWDEAEGWLALHRHIGRETPSRLGSEARLAAHRGEHERALELAAARSSFVTEAMR